MRISSNMMFENNVAAINQLQSRLLQTNQQMTSGLRMSSASDDPVAAARALELTQSEATNTQYTANRESARSTLAIADSTLQGVTSAIQDMQGIAITAGHGSLDSAARKSLASNLNGTLQTLLGLANSTDGQGNYLFSGFQSRTKPFVDTATGAAYLGDDGQHRVQVAANQQMSASDSGADIFMRIKNGNGVFDVKPAATNTGTGGVVTGTVTDPVALTGNSYSLTFSVAAGVTTYDVTNTTTGAVLSTGNAYASGQSIAFDGMQTSVSGVPANGDTFTVQPSSNESVFSTIKDLIVALNAPVGSGNLASSVSRSLGNLDKALSSALTAQATVGMRMNQLDALQASGDSLGLQLKKTLSNLQDTDYVKAAIDLNQQNVGLQAAQKSYAQISQLSLFNYI